MNRKQELLISNKLKSDGYFVIKDFLKKRFRQKIFKLFKEKR